MANSLKLFFFYQRWQTENQTGLHFYVSLSKGADLFIYLAYFLSHFPSLCIFPAFCKSQAFADCLFMEIGDFPLSTAFQNNQQTKKPVFFICKRPQQIALKWYQTKFNQCSTNSRLLGMPLEKSAILGLCIGCFSGSPMGSPHTTLGFYLLFFFCWITSNTRSRKVLMY